jgi:predicted RNA-binding protein
MCEANAYWINDEGTDLIMESVDVLEPRGENTWHLVSIFGDQKNVTGKIKIMHLVDHKIFFEELSDAV